MPRRRNNINRTLINPSAIRIVRSQATGMDVEVGWGSQAHESPGSWAFLHNGPVAAEKTVQSKCSFSGSAERRSKLGERFVQAVLCQLSTGGLSGSKRGRENSKWSASALTNGSYNPRRSINTLSAV